MLKFLKWRKKRVVKHDRIDDDPEEDPHNNTFLREWGTNTDNSALSSPSDVFSGAKTKVNGIQDVVSAPEQSTDVEQSEGQEKQNTKDQQKSPEKSGVFTTLPCSQYPGPSSAEECPEEEKDAGKSEKKLANHISSGMEEACPSKKDKDHPKMDRLYKTPVEVPKRRSHSLELGVIKRQDQQPSKPVEAFPKGRPPPPPEKQFSQWSVKNQDVKPLRADHNEYHLNSLRPQIILSDTPSRTQTPRKKFPPASVPLERRGAPPDQSIQTDEPFISGRTFPPYWGSFWYPPPPSHPPGPWYMNHQPPWEQPGSQPQTSTSLWTPVLPFTFPIPNNVGTTNSSPEKEERSFIGSVKSPESGRKVIQRKEVSIWRKDREGNITTEMEEVKTEGTLKQQDETIEEVIEHKPPKKERKSRSPSPVVGVIDFYNLENISDENASNVTVTSSDEEDEIIEDEISKLLKKVREKRKELRSRRESKSPPKSRKSINLKKSLKKAGRSIEPINDENESPDEDDEEDEEEYTVSPKEEKRPLRKRFRECKCPPQPTTSRCQQEQQLPEREMVDFAGVQQLHEQLEEERAIADDLRLRLLDLSAQAAEMDGANKTLVEEINSLHKGMEQMLMSKTKLENSLMNLKQEMKMQRCQQCGQSLSVCQCQSMSVVCEEPQSEERKQMHHKLRNLRSESEALDNKWDKLEMEIQLLQHEREEVEKERQAVMHSKKALSQQQHRLNEERAALQQEMQKIETDRLALDLRADGLRRLRRELKHREKTLEKVNNMQFLWGNQLEYRENEVQRQIDSDAAHELEREQEDLDPRHYRSRSWIRGHSSRKHNIRPSKGRSRSYPDFGPRSHPDDCRPSTPQIVHASCCRFMGRSPEGYDDVVMEVESKELLFSDREEAEVRDERHRERQRCRPKNRHARSQSRSPVNRNYDKVSRSRAELVHESRRSRPYHQDKRPRLATCISSTEVQFEAATNEPLEDLDESPDNGSLESPPKVKNKTGGYQMPLLTQLMEKVKQLEEERMHLLMESDQLKRVVTATEQRRKGHEDNKISMGLRTNSLKGWSNSRNFLELSSLAYAQENPQGYRKVTAAEPVPNPYMERCKRVVGSDDDGDDFAADADIDDDDDGGGEEDHSKLHLGAQAMFTKNEAYFRYPSYAVGRPPPAQISRGSLEGHHELAGKGRDNARDLHIYYQATHGYLQSAKKKVVDKKTTPPKIMPDLPEKFQRNKLVEKGETTLKVNSSGLPVMDRPNQSSSDAIMSIQHNSDCPSQAQQVSGTKFCCKCRPMEKHRHIHPDPRCTCAHHAHHAHHHLSYVAASHQCMHHREGRQEQPVRNQLSPQPSPSLSERAPLTDSDVSQMPVAQSAAPEQNAPFVAYAYDKTTTRSPSRSYARETTGIDVAIPQPTERNNSKILQSEAETTNFGTETNCCQVLGHLLLERETSRVSANLEQLHRLHQKKTAKMRQQIRQLKARQKQLLQKMKEGCMKLMSKELRGRDDQLAEERHSQDQLKQAVVELQKQLSDMERELIKATFAKSSLLKEANSGREHFAEQMKKMRQTATSVKNEKQNLLKKLSTALQENASLKAQLDEAKKGSQLFEGQAVRLRKKLNTYRDLAELCHNKYKSQKEQTEQVYKELDVVSKRLLGSEGTVGHLKKHLRVARHRARKRKREVEGLKVERDNIKSERQQEIEASARLEKEKKETEEKLKAETLRYQQLLREVQSQRQRLSCVATKMQALDPSILQRQMEIRFSAEMSLVLKQVTSFLEQSAASSEAAALADQERQFRNRAHENTISTFIRKYEHLMALKEAAEMEAFLLNELSKSHRNRGAGSWPETTAFVDLLDIRREPCPPAWLGPDIASPSQVPWLDDGLTSTSPPLFRSFPNTTAAHMTCPQPRMNIVMSSPQRDWLRQNPQNSARFPIRQQQNTWTSQDRNRDWTSPEEGWDRWPSTDRGQNTLISPDRGLGIRTTPDRDRDSWVYRDQYLIPFQSVTDPLAGQPKLPSNTSEKEVLSDRQSSEDKGSIDIGSSSELSTRVNPSDTLRSSTLTPLDRHSAKLLDNVTVTTRGIQEVHAEKSSLLVSSEKFSFHATPILVDQTERKSLAADSGLGHGSSKGGVFPSTHSFSNTTSEVRSPSLRTSTGYSEKARMHGTAVDSSSREECDSVRSSPVDGFLPAKYLTRQPTPTEEDSRSE